MARKPAIEQFFDRGKSLGSFSSFRQAKQ